MWKTKAKSIESVRDCEDVTLMALEDGARGHTGQEFREGQKAEKVMKQIFTCNLQKEHSPTNAFILVKPIWNLTSKM